MTEPFSATYTLATRPCLVDIGRFRWDIYNNDSLFETSAESFDNEEEARAKGFIEMRRLSD
jgi:hypothetical protein